MSRFSLAVLLTLLGVSTRASNDPSTLDYGLAADVDTLDPHWGYDAVSLFIVDQVYETLIDFKGESLDTYEPRIATVVPTLENGFQQDFGLFAAARERGDFTQCQLEAGAQDLRLERKRRLKRCRLVLAHGF